MGWFSKRSSTLVPAEVLEQLGAFGQVSWDAMVAGRPPDDPRFGWQSFFSKAQSAFRENLARSVAEVDSAAGDDAIARFGGYRLIAEFEPHNQEPVFLDMMDGALQSMFTRGLSSGHMSRFEADRWIAVHGDLRTSFDRIVDVIPPDPDHTVSVEMNPGDALMVAVMGPGALDNQFWIELGNAGSYGAFSMRKWESDDVTLTRCSEDDVGQWESVDGVLRGLGSMLRTQPYWAHEQLDPYFTERRER
jgi:hypothetical protein